ncbi:hypothetical protein [Kibdelosporangium phytohabitans]|uniref:Uncharacterized protein n=1 Tax=Kibdelosporangium phytohabitans TaxID=860235 RepID=A0A0N9I7G2_9PSEU|nr:hypothetical protein [Kibdelosporangium phytohabitans]ALG10842.1 hypothetical protein AOZ06_31680 [Kibdelosporangium phytohabitans]MBE1462017.1 hypothetical protein [Kibdelosporangium phytohabitans]
MHREESWLATTVKRLLADKYGGRIPGVRRISADIAEANGGDTISHGHVHNILTGEAENLTDRTRVLLARFFGKQPAFFHPPEHGTPNADSVHALAARLATFDQAQLDAIRTALDIASGQRRPDED